MQTEEVKRVNETLRSNLYVPRPSRHPHRIMYDQNFPFNPDYVNLDISILEIISNHYHKFPGYTDSNGTLLAREFFAKQYGVSPDDVTLVPTVEQARWYLTTLFLDHNDIVVCNEGLKPDLARVKTDLNYVIRGFEDEEKAKVIMLRNPDIDSENERAAILRYTQNLRSLEKSFKSPKALVIEEPYALFGKDNPINSVLNAEMPENTVVYLLTHLNQVLLNEVSGFSVIILLNNQSKKFNQINQALFNMTCFYNPPNTALHPHTPQIMEKINFSRALINYKQLEERKRILVQKFNEKGVTCFSAPEYVFKIGIKKTSKVVELLEKGILVVPIEESLRHSDFIYLSVLHSDLQFETLLTRITQK